jgi:hypothetical protein
LREVSLGSYVLIVYEVVMICVLPNVALTILIGKFKHNKKRINENQKRDPNPFEGLVFNSKATDSFKNINLNQIENKRQKKNQIRSQENSVKSSKIFIDKVKLKAENDDIKPTLKIISEKPTKASDRLGLVGRQINRSGKLFKKRPSEDGAITSVQVSDFNEIVTANHSYHRIRIKMKMKAAETDMLLKSFLQKQGSIK